MGSAGEANADVIVVGAGIAGLIAVWHLRQLRLLVLEAAGRAGGRICSEPPGGYWLNFGLHLFPGAEYFACMPCVIWRLAGRVVPGRG